MGRELRGMMRAMTRRTRMNLKKTPGPKTRQRIRLRMAKTMKALKTTTTWTTKWKI